MLTFNQFSLVELYPALSAAALLLITGEKRSADHFSLQRDPIHVFILPFMQYFIFFFLTKESHVEMQHPKASEDSKHALSCWPALNITGPTDACDMKRKMKSDSCLSFQTAELTDDLPVRLAYVKFLFPASLSHLYSMMRMLQELTGRAVSKVSLKLTGAQSTCNLYSVDQSFL